MYVRHTYVYRTIACVVLCFSLGLPLSAADAAEEPELLESQLDAYLKQQQDEMAGLAAIILQKDRVIVRLEGFADIERQIPVDADTIFEWGSVSKLLVWISTLQLAESGKVDVEEDILSYLPSDFRTKSSFAKPVTLSNLMHHNAGYDDSFTDLFLNQQADVLSLRQVLEQADVRQVFPPGEVVSYSNYGSALAAYVVEEVSGMDYRDYVRKHIFDPLNMTKTAIDPALNDNHWVKEQRRRVQGYTSSRQLIKPNQLFIPLYPAGSTMGTAGDLQILLESLLAKGGGPLFTNKRTVDQLVTPSLMYPGTEIPRIASGLFYLPSESQHVFGHGGNTKAFSSAVYIDRNDQIGVLVLTNSQYDSVYTAGIPEIVFGKYVHSDIATDLEDASRWTGMYEPARVPDTVSVKCTDCLSEAVRNRAD
ncbi:hypothetical protein NCCP2716_11620 [Sporosarcina sp. NCCP-2716]|uniref:serine hydrolase domain-containing protein n=1 Tax=Sporosarcina sp. NCCP-2716 TaxID=2943679 RepID=UPI00203C686F|nr:serine hydrolase domain-containing protein [Sporosarcina sp. NCCP-2716]GKV68664.1 hypothetical protein NCCP2716_11620 [Sporosarcina sp. NCCP-2716]